MKFREVVYGSNQKSILTGAAGFGIRTCTEGLECDIIDALRGQGIFGYPVSPKRAVTLEQIVNTPEIIANFPKTFRFMPLDMNGETYWIFSRTFYIGIDYGYFCGDPAQRTGSNYIAHVLIFDVQPDDRIFNLLVYNNCFANSVFRPVDERCVPDNSDITELLTGKPRYLQSNMFDLSAPITVPQPDIQIGMVLKGFFALAGSERQGESPKKLIIKAPAKDTDRILGTALMIYASRRKGNFSFITNYMDMGMSENIDIVCVNEHHRGELWEEGHIVVDLFAGTVSSIEDNPFYRMLGLIAQKGDADKLRSFLDFAENRKMDTEGDFQYMFFAIKSGYFDESEIIFQFMPQLRTAELSGQSLIWIIREIAAIGKNGMMPDRIYDELVEIIYQQIWRVERLPSEIKEALGILLSVKENKKLVDIWGMLEGVAPQNVNADYLAFALRHCEQNCLMEIFNLYAESESIESLIAFAERNPDLTERLLDILSDTLATPSEEVRGNVIAAVINDQKWPSQRIADFCVAMQKKTSELSAFVKQNTGSSFGRIFQKIFSK